MCAFSTGTLSQWGFRSGFFEMQAFCRVRISSCIAWLSSYDYIFRYIISCQSIGIYLERNEDIWILVDTVFLFALAMLGLPLSSPLWPRLGPLHLGVVDLWLAGDQGLLLLLLRRCHSLALLDDVLEDVFSFRVVVTLLRLFLVHGEQLGSRDRLRTKLLLEETFVRFFWYSSSGSVASL